MYPIKNEIIRKIKENGYISIEEYMKICLYDPEHGYYTSTTSIGSSGDFITSPEISQMFGELVGLWIAQVWLDQGSIAPIGLVELGPGKGTLMMDILRATSNVPNFFCSSLRNT